MLLLFLLSHSHHSLIFESLTMVSRDGQWVPQMHVGPLFAFHWLYYILLISSGIYLMIRWLIDLKATRGISLLLIVFLFSVITDMSAYRGFLPVYMPPIAQMVTCMVIVYVFFRKPVLDIVPIGRAAVFDNIEEGVLLLSERNRIIDLNKAMRQMAGLPSSGLIGKRATEVLGAWIDSVADPSFHCQFGNAHYEALATPLRDRAGVSVGRLLLFRDITARRMAEAQQQHYTQELEETRKHLERLDSFKSRFFANISHELRTPLTLMLGPLEALLDEDRLPHPDRERVSVALHQARRQLQLVRQLLDLSRLEVGKLKLSVCRYDLASFLKRIVGVFKSHAQERQIKVVFETVEEPVTAYFDGERMEQVFTNLLRNALKFTEPGGRIAIRVALEDETFVAIQVADTGIGIPAEAQKAIFERFYQVDNSPSRAFEGTGIGLALVAELVKLHGGHVTVVSTLGVGSTFVVRLRLGRQHFDEVDHEPPSEAPSPPKQAGPLGAPPSEAVVVQQELEEAALILIIEDSGDMRAYIRSCLGSQYRLLEAADGLEGRDLAFETVPDLVITDLMMPRLDGFGVCQVLAGDRRTSHVPIIMLTARTEQKSRIQGLDRGVDAYLVKPFRVEELRAQIRNLLLSRQKMQAYYGQARLVIGPRKVDLPDREAAFMEKLVTVIENSLEDSAFRTSLLAAEVAMSERQLQRKLRALTGEGPNALIRRLRLERAAQLLTKGLSVSEVTYAVGFTNPSYFAERFRAQFGKEPSAFHKG